MVERVSENRVFMNTYGEMGFQNGAHIIHWKRWAKIEEKPSLKTYFTYSATK